MPHAGEDRCAASRLASQRAVWVATAWLVLVVAGPAQSASVDVFFDGLGTTGEPDVDFGLSQAQAEMVRDDFGVPFVDNWNFLGTAEGTYQVSQNVQSFTPDPPTSSLNRATSSWDVTNISGEDLDGASYLVLTHTTPIEVDGVDIDYNQNNVGITIDADLGWVILLASQGGDDYFYPAILLDRSVTDPLDGMLDVDETSDPFSIEYVVKESLIDAPEGSDKYQLPKLQIARGFAVVPEPGTGALLAAALTLLALRGRRRP